ncbi:hypothetical protein CDAR_568381 [Caerostris darwini]|uniref:XK-related protein n=1 Tax=Caerostris darwini TaxID=1538125 RepID=A0AAV4PHG2_9ARAC|nr:hypothetical protein CDAR_568381 [Caerostris darwini]
MEQVEEDNLSDWEGYAETVASTVFENIAGQVYFVPTEVNETESERRCTLFEMMCLTLVGAMTVVESACLIAGEYKLAVLYMHCYLYPAVLIGICLCIYLLKDMWDVFQSSCPPSEDGIRIQFKRNSN